MGKLKHYLDLIRNGDVFYNEKIKFSIIVYTVGLVHAAYSVLFFIAGVKTFGIYNALIVVAYQGINILIQKKKYLLVVILTNVEIVSHCVTAALFLGGDSGFQFLIAGLIPVIFYLAVAWNCFKHTEIACMIFSVGFFAAFLFTTIFTRLPFYKLLISLQEWQNEAFLYINISVMFATTIWFLYMFLWDISHKNLVLAQKNSQLDEMANKDPLTKLYNRRYMDGKIQEKLELLSTNGKIFCMILGDIDDFKKVNDTYGHEVGDAVLVAISKCMVDDLRDTDFVCRWGGEEFMIVIDGNHKIGMDLAERIRKKVEKLEVPAGTKNISVTMTYGVSESIPGWAVDKLVKVADDNLYKGKMNGKNQVVG